MTEDLRQTRRSLPIALLRARERVMLPLREMLAKSGINEQKWRVLRVLAEAGPMELSQVAHEASLLLSSLTRMVPPMEAEGLVARRTSDEDRRRTILSITTNGEALLARHSAESNAIFARLARDYGPDRLELLLDMLEDLQKLNTR